MQEEQRFQCQRPENSPVTASSVHACPRPGWEAKSVHPAQGQQVQGWEEVQMGQNSHKDVELGLQPEYGSQAKGAEAPQLLLKAHLCAGGLIPCHTAKEN